MAKIKQKGNKSDIFLLFVRFWGLQRKTQSRKMNNGSNSTQNILKVDDIVFRKLKAIFCAALSVMLMLTVCLPCFGTVSAATEEFWYKTYDFEDSTVGDGLPDPFFIETNDMADKHSIVSDSTQGNCLKAVDDSTAKRTSTDVKFTKMYGTFEFEFKVKFDKCARTTIGLCNQYSNPFTAYHAVGFYFYDDGSIFAKNGNTNAYLVQAGADTGYSRGEWVTVKFVVNVTAKTWDVYYNEGKSDAASLTGLNFRNTNLAYLDQFGIGPFANQTVTYWLDDIKVPTDTKPEEPVVPQEPISLDRYIPEYNELEILYDANVETPETDPSFYTRAYLAFPTIKKINDQKVVIVYKRGIEHAWNVAHDEVMIYNPTTEKIESRDVLYNADGENPQNPELVKMPNGDLIALLDRQYPADCTSSKGTKTVEKGVAIMRSTDGGDTWALDAGNTTDEYTNNDAFALLQDNEGVQYGSTYDDLIVGDTAYVLAFTHETAGLELGGTAQRGTDVPIIKTDDNGHSWTYVTSLTDLAGTAINESAFIELSNGDFFFICRGYDESTIAIRTDSNFNLIKKTVVSADYYSLGYIGRPKLFEKDGEYYLVCRNVRKDANEELALYRFDVENLVPETYVVIEEPMTSARAGNGHYSEPYFITKDGVEYVNFINYTNAYTGDPDLVRYELIWDEIKDPVIKETTDTENKTTVATPVMTAKSWKNNQNPLWDKALSNLSLAFEYTAKSDSVLYFDVVDGDYDNCYSVELNPSGMALNRIVAGVKTALSTYTGFETGKYYEIKLVRYMGDIKVYVGDTLKMSIAEENQIFPVVSGDVKTHWKGNIYLDDKGAVTNIKVYDSGLITFEGNVAKLGNLKVKDDIAPMITNGTTSNITHTDDGMKISISGGSNPSVYTTAWLDSDVGDFVLTFTDKYNRNNWCNHALIFAATPTAEAGVSQYFQGFNSNSFDTKNAFDGGYALVTGVQGVTNLRQTQYTFHSITTKGSYTTLTPVTSAGTLYRPHNIKVVKKADRLTVTMGNDILGYHTVYDGVSDHIVGNIFAAVQQDTSFISDIKVTDTENAIDTVIVEDDSVLGDLTEDKTVSADDLTVMRKHLLDVDVFSTLSKVDVNGDGYVDIRDLVRLKKEIVK